MAEDPNDPFRKIGISPNGHDPSVFAAKLAEHGYILAQGQTQGRFAVVGADGMVYNLGKNLLDANPAEISRELPDGSYHVLPTIDEALAMQDGRRELADARVQAAVEGLHQLDDDAGKALLEPPSRADVREELVENHEVKPPYMPPGAEGMSTSEAADKLEETFMDAAGAVGKAGKAAARVGDGLLKMVDGLLDFFSPSPSQAPKYGQGNNDLWDGKPREFTPAQLLRSPEARQVNALQGVYMRQRDEALDRIAEDIREGNNLRLEDLRRLGRAELENIRATGGANLHDLIREHEKQQKRAFSSGRAREHQREHG